MAGYIVLLTLAAMGLLSLLWLFWGFLLPEAKGGVLVFSEWPGEERLRWFRWLRDMGLLHCPMILVTEDPPGGDGLPLGTEIEICSPDALWQRLERERTDLDGTGNGDPPGRGQRRGISEL